MQNLGCCNYHNCEEDQTELPVFWKRVQFQHSRYSKKNKAFKSLGSSWYIKIVYDFIYKRHNE